MESRVCQQCGRNLVEHASKCSVCGLPTSHEKIMALNASLQMAEKLIQQKEYKKSLDILRTIESYSAEADLNIGMMYWLGKGVERDDRTAEKYFLEAINKGYVDSENILGKFYCNWAKREFTKLNENYDFILELLTKSLKRGYKDALEMCSHVSALKAIQLRKQETSLEFGDEVERYIKIARSIPSSETSSILADFYLVEALKSMKYLYVWGLSDYSEKLLDEAAELGNTEIKLLVANEYLVIATLETDTSDGHEVSSKTVRYLAKVERYGSQKLRDTVSMIYETMALQAFYLQGDVQVFEKYRLMSKMNTEKNKELIGMLLFSKGTEFFESEYSDSIRELGLTYIRKAAKTYNWVAAQEYIKNNGI